MFGWFKELLDIRYEFKRKKQELIEDQFLRESSCPSCEVLKVELANERREKQQLLDHLLTPQVAAEERTTAPPVQVPNRHMPWKVRQQALEQSDREKAHAMREFHKRDQEARQTTASSSSNPVPLITPATSIEDLERNLGVVQEK